MGRNRRRQYKALKKKKEDARRQKEEERKWQTKGKGHKDNPYENESRTKQISRIITKIIR